MNQHKIITISLIIVSSFEPLYLACNEITRKQCSFYKIPVFFLFNGELPKDYILKNDERLLAHTDKSSRPYMFLKFKNMLKEIFDIANPDFILRCNSSTFINFKRLFSLVETLPREKLIAGPFYYATGFTYLNLFCQGTNIFFSNDVAKRLAYDTNENNPKIFEHDDDAAIDILVRDYAQKYDLTFCTHRIENFSVVPKFQDIIIKPNHIFFRVKNDVPNRTEIDYEIWKILYHLFDVIHYNNNFETWERWHLPCK
jgi:hypothetical protein